MSEGYLPVAVKKENRLDYYNALDEYASKGELDSFTEFIADLEENEIESYLQIATSQGLVKEDEFKRG